MIHFTNETDFFSLTKEKDIKVWIKKTIEKESKHLGDINYIFCSDKYLLTLNKKYLNHNYYTDVITFDYSQSNILSGDIFISIDRVADNAKKYDTVFMTELLRVIIHGVLHLIGYDDKTETDKIIMTSKEDIYLKLFTNVK